MTTPAQVHILRSLVFPENKTQVGVVEEVLGLISEVYFSVKPVVDVVGSIFQAGNLLFMESGKPLPPQRFL